MVGKKLMLAEICLYSIVKQFPSSMVTGALSFLSACLGLLLSKTPLLPWCQSSSPSLRPEHCRAAVPIHLRQGGHWVFLVSVPLF